MNRFKDLSKVVAAMSEGSGQLKPEQIHLSAEDAQSIGEMIGILNTAEQVLEETPFDQAA